jgi:hypothetical protein
METQRYENRFPEDVGCKVGRGNGKIGVKRDIVKQLVARINTYKDSYEYTQLVSNKGLKLVFHDEALGSKSNATVWQDKNGRLYYEFEREE